MKLLHISYTKACNVLHANTYSNINRIGDKYKELNIIDTSPKVNGTEWALFFSAANFAIIVSICSDNFNIDNKHLIDKLNKLQHFYLTINKK